jgi:hypothetical protein
MREQVMLVGVGDSILSTGSSICKCPGVGVWLVYLKNCEDNLPKNSQREEFLIMRSKCKGGNVLECIYQQL